MLEELAKARQDLVVNQVNIDRTGSTHIDWQSPLAQQYNIQSTPSYTIYDANGKVIAKGEEAAQRVSKMMEFVRQMRPAK